MKMRRILLLVCGVLGIGVIACSEVVDDSTPTDESSEVDVAKGDRPEVGAAELAEPELAEPAEPAEPADDNVSTLAATCTQTCSAVYNSTGASCGTFYGYGRTTFLGSCQKACNKAYENAAQQAAAVGCRLTYCTKSGC